jgi:heme/copper-type cytochrome/quinol oxidase subunit 2
MVARKTLLVVGIILTIYLASLSYYVYFYEGQTAAANSVDIYISIVGGKTSNASAMYSPDNFIVVEGKHVTLVVSNGDTVSHVLAIPQFNVTTGEIQAGDTVQVAFSPDQTGTFEFEEPPGGCGSDGGAGCGGGSGSGGQLLTGNMTVISQPP